MPGVKRTRLQMRAAAQKQQWQFKNKKRKLGVVSTGAVPGGKTYVPRGISNRPELKHFDQTVGAASLDTWQMVTNSVLCSIRLGTGPTQRIGRKIRVKSVVFRGRMELGVAANNANSAYTIDFIWDKQTNGATPTIGTIYTGSSAYSLPNPDNDERFEWVKRISRDDPASNFTLVNTKFNCNKLISYDSDLGTVADLTQNNLIMTMCSPFDGTPTLAGELRVYFMDE